MITMIRTSLTMFLLMTVLTGAIYPAIVTEFAQLFFPFQANGSFIQDGDNAIGSELIGQPFDSPNYFWGRLSATASQPYNAAASSGSNYGPRHPDLVANAKARVEAVGSRDVGVPIDLVTASGSGLDPHISPAAAVYQVERVAKARNLPIEKILALVASHVEGRMAGVLGEPRVNVLMLNLDLDRLMDLSK